MSPTLTIGLKLFITCLLFAGIGLIYLFTIYRKKKTEEVNNIDSVILVITSVFIIGLIASLLGILWSL